MVMMMMKNVFVEVQYWLTGPLCVLTTVLVTKKRRPFIVFINIIK
jgi:hypothetical protein